MADRSPKGPSSSEIWFAPKRYGYGTGRPVRWQGWVTLCVFLLVTLGGPFGMLLLHPGRPLVAVLVVNGITLVAVILFLWVCKTRTEGGWRWRWGDKD